MLLIVYRIDKSQEENSISKVIEETKSNLEGIETNNEAVKKNEFKNFELGRKIASKDPEITQVKIEANKSKSDRSLKKNKDYENLQYCILCFLGT